MASIDLNSDLGEGVGDDAAMFGIVTSANVACGFHAGGPETMLESAHLAVEHQVSVGAHPSYRDREGFGRRDMGLEPDVLRIDILEQLDALTDIADVRIRYLKPHGALYNRIVVDAKQANVVAACARDATLPILGLGGTEIHKAADRLDVQFFREAFVDRAYRPDGSLVPRSEPGAVITDQDEAAARAVRMVEEGTVLAIDGTLVHVRLDSLCVHGDTPGAVAMAELVRSKLVAAGIELRAFA